MVAEMPKKEAAPAVMRSQAQCRAGKTSPGVSFFAIGFCLSDRIPILDDHRPRVDLLAVENAFARWQLTQQSSYGTAVSEGSTCI